MENENQIKQDSGLSSRSLIGSTACKPEVNLFILSGRELMVYFGIAEANSDDLTCLLILDEIDRRKLAITE